MGSRYLSMTFHLILKFKHNLRCFGGSQAWSLVSHLFEAGAAVGADKAQYGTEPNLLSNYVCVLFGAEEEFAQNLRWKCSF